MMGVMALGNVVLHCDAAQGGPAAQGQGQGQGQGLRIGTGRVCQMSWQGQPGWRRSGGL